MNINLTRLERANIKNSEKCRLRNVQVLERRWKKYLNIKEWHSILWFHYISMDMNFSFKIRRCSMHSIQAMLAYVGFVLLTYENTIFGTYKNRMQFIYLFKILFNFLDCLLIKYSFCWRGMYFLKNCCSRCNLRLTILEQKITLHTVNNCLWSPL